MTITRDDLFAIAKAAGWTPGTPLTPAQKLSIATTLKNRLGQIVTATVIDPDNGAPIAAKPADILRSILEELS